MNILRKIVKETLLLPVRVIEGVEDAIDHVVYPKEEKKKEKRDE